MRVGQARKRDSNEAEIVKALRGQGVEVFHISGPGAPDLLVRFRRTLYGFEVKNLKGKRTKAQQRTQWQMIRTVSDALAAIGLK